MSQERLDQLADGIRQANASGDRATVEALGAEYKALLGGGSQPAPAAKNSDLLTAADHGLQNFQADLYRGTQSVADTAKPFDKAIAQGHDDVINQGISGFMGWVRKVGEKGEARNEKEATELNYERPAEYDGFTKNIRDAEFGRAFGSLGYQAAESAASIGTGVLATAGSTIGSGGIVPAIGALATAGTFVGQLGSLREEKGKKGLDPTATPADFLSAAVGTGIEKIPLAGGLGTKIVGEATQEGLQELSQIAAVMGQGGAYTPDEVINRTIDSVATGGVISGGMHGSKSAYDATVDGASKVASKVGEIIPTNIMSRTDNFTPDADDIQLAADLDDYAGEGGLGDTYRSRPSMDNGVALSGDQNKAKGLLNRHRAALDDMIGGFIKYSEKVHGEAGRDTRIILQSLQEVGKNMSSTFSTNDINRVQAAFDGHQDANRLAAHLRQMNKLITFTSSDADLGGLRRLTKKWDILDPRNGGLAGMAVVGGIGSMAAGPLGVVVPVAAGFLTNRMAIKFDKLTNRNSTIKRYVDSVKANAAKGGVQAPPVPDQTIHTALNELVEKQKADKAAETLAKKTAQEVNRQGVAAEKRVESEQKADAAWNAQHLAGKFDPKQSAQPNAQGQQQAPAQGQAPVQEGWDQATLENKANATMWQTDEVPHHVDENGVRTVHPAFKGYALWTHYTGINSPNKLVDVAEEMEAQNLLPQGTTQRITENMHSFSEKEASPLQSLIRDYHNAQTGSNYVPLHYDDVQRKAALNSAAVLKAKAAYDKGATSIGHNGTRAQQLSKQGNRMANELQAKLEKEGSQLPANQYEAMLLLKREIDSPELTRIDRVERTKQVLAAVFGPQTPMFDHWYKQFLPLAAHGNDFVATKRVEEELKVETEFDKKVERIKKAVEKHKSKQNSGRMEKEVPSAAPTTKSVSEQPYLDQSKNETQPALANTNEPSVDVAPKSPTNILADKALAKLSSKPEQLGFDFDQPAAETALDLKTPNDVTITGPQERPKGNVGKKSIQHTRDGYSEKLQGMADRLLTHGGEYEAYKMSLNQETTQGRVLNLLFDNASVSQSVNSIIDSYASKYRLPASQAVSEVLPVIQQGVEAGELSVQMTAKNTDLKHDDSVVRDDEGNRLKVIQLNVPNTSPLYDHFQTAMAVNYVNRSVPQGGPPEFNFQIGATRYGEMEAFKDGTPELADPNNPQPLQDFLDFINGLRNQQLSMNPKILQQIEDGMSKAQSPLPSILRKKDKNGKDINAPLYALGQIKWQHGIDGEVGDTKTYQEYFAGKNGRIYSRNGLAHTQSGDLMKGLTRLDKKVAAGSVEGLDLMYLTIGNVVGFEKASPIERRMSIQTGPIAQALYDFASDPTKRDTLKDRKGENTLIGKITGKGKDFFQVLNAAHEVKDMVDFAKVRHPHLKDATAEQVLGDDNVKKDLATNYQTDYIVQLDASNNAYQIAGMVMGSPRLLEATGLNPKQGVNPDLVQGGDIYMEPALKTAEAIPELRSLPADALRKVFKPAIGTYLYAAADRTRIAAFRSKLSDYAEGAPLFSTKPDEGIWQVPPEVSQALLSPNGFKFETAKTAARVVPVQTEKKSGYRIELQNRNGWEQSPRIFETPDDVVTELAERDLMNRMNRTLISNFEAQYPEVREYMDFAADVAKVVKERSKLMVESEGLLDPRSREKRLRELSKIKVPTPDGLVLNYEFNDAVDFEGIPTTVGKYENVNLGVRSQEANEKLSGNGLAAFFTHAMDAYLLRTTYNRMAKSGGIDGFNPIHDSYGFSARDALRGRETYLQAFYELGQENFNLFVAILQANGIDPSMVRLPSRKGVEPKTAQQVPTALS